MARRTKIVCTLGPAVDGDDALRDLLDAGMNVARLNFSHGSHEEHARRIAAVRRQSAQTGIPCAIMLDTKGPEIRTGMLAEGRPLTLRAGQTLVLTSDAGADGSDGRVWQSCADLADSLALGALLLLDDGLIELVVTRLSGADIECQVQNDGVLGQRKSINVPGVQLPLPAVTDQDRADLLFGIEQGVDVVAASFVRDGAGVREIKRFLAEHGGAGIGVIAKIEAAGALDNIRDIVLEADGIMVARGDLGVEVPAYRVPYLQKEIIHLCNRESKPVITATQMLDSMIRNPRPTRAEVADVANAIYDGTDCVMLSGETASGRHPVEAVRTMARIAAETEPHLFDDALPDRRRTHARASLAVGIAAVQTAETLDAACIIAPTVSGRTARLISNLRPRMPIYAVTPDARVMRQMMLSWGVTPLLDDMQGGMREVLGNAVEKVRACGFAKPGDLAVVTAGDPETAPCEDLRSGYQGVSATNVMQVVQVR
ncbi:MAG TPA: pyruvate kinase [Candidatus Aphodovivens avistercoris]|nr:pyruvate kinase [Candidatus Aphodovivens avistercoris]